MKITTLKLANSQPTHKVVLVNKDPAARWAEIQIINRKALKYITDLQTENTYFFSVSGFHAHSFQNVSLYLLDWMERCDNYR